jgi:hypothetical protein
MDHPLDPANLCNQSDDSGRDDFAEPISINALRMARFLVPLDDAAMGLDAAGIEKNLVVAKSLLLWPPNLFAFTSEMLSATGAYYLVVSPPKDQHDRGKEVWPPETYKTIVGPEDSWASDVRKWGRAWRDLLNKKSQDHFLKNLNPKKVFDSAELDQLLKETVPDEIMECWENFAAGFDNGDMKDLACLKPGPERSRHWKYFVHLMTLHAVADEACLGWGIRQFVSIWGEEKRSEAQVFAEDLLGRRGTLATIHEDRCRVLPKRHTPNVGMTLRSISTSLALYHRSSLDVKWRPAVETPLTKNGEPITSLNVLLLPWPYKIWASDFKQWHDAPYQNNSGREAFFQYLPDGDSQDEASRTKLKERDEGEYLEIELPDLLAKASAEGGRVDLVILPELAISNRNIPILESKLKQFGVSGYIAGVRDTGDDDDDDGTQRFSRNMVYCKFLRREVGGFNFPPNKEANIDYRQHKHHRWKLDRSQIVSYQLGGCLPPTMDWWEGIKLSRRKVTFINVGNEITICPLICEDLARQEPISDLIRAVGPTLVVAILMDGPQKMSRWSAGYASVLADDPRSSVLTFTCLGMVEKMQIPGVPKSRAVALWKDPLHRPNEIELGENKRAILLYLNVEDQKEVIADGRVEEVATPYLTLGGTTQI